MNKQKKWCKLFTIEGNQVLFMLAGQREDIDEECCMNVIFMYDDLWVTVTFSFETEESAYFQIEKLNKDSAKETYNSLLAYVTESMNTNVQ